jgi:hypothetical protein
MLFCLKTCLLGAQKLSFGERNDRIVELNAGLEQTILPNQSLGIYDYQNLTVSSPLGVFGQNLRVTGRVSIINGVFISQASGISFSYEKPDLKKVKNKVSVKNINTAIPKTITDSIHSTLKIDTALKVSKPVLPKVGDIISIDKSIGLDSFNLNPKLNKNLLPKPDSISLNEVPLDLSLINPLDSLNVDSLSIPQKAIKVKDRSNFFSKVNSFNFGLSSLSISDLTVSGLSYNGIHLNYQLGNRLTFTPTLGISNRLPSLDQLIRQPFLLSNYSGGALGIFNSGKNNLVTNSLLINQDIMNLTTSNVFGAFELEKKLDEGLALKLTTFFSKTLRSDFDREYVSNVTSVKFSKSVKDYDFSIELANSTYKRNVINVSDSLVGAIAPSNVPVSLALSVSARVNITRNLKFISSYRNLSNSFYSPLLLFNNNLINRFSSGLQFSLFDRKISSSTNIFTGMLRTNKAIVPNRGVSQDVIVRIREGFDIQMNYSFSALGDSLFQGKNYNLQGTISYTPRTNKNHHLNASILKYDFSQLEVSDSLFNNFTSLCTEYIYDQREKGSILFSSELARISNNLFSNSRILKTTVLNDVKIISGVSYIQSVSNYWLNIVGGLSYLMPSKLYSVNLLAEKSVVSNQRSLFSGSINFKLNF